MSTQAGKGRGRGYGKGKSPRDSRRPAPSKSRLTSTGPAKGGPVHGTRAHLQPGQCLFCRQMGHMAQDCPNRGMRDDSGINLKRVFGSFVGMTGKVSSLFFYEAGYHDDSTTGSRARLRIHYVSRARCNLTVSFIYLGTHIFHWLPWPARSKTKCSCSVGTQTEPETAPTSSPTRQRTSHTVMITGNGVQSTMIHRSSPVCSNLIHSMKSQCPSPWAGVFAEWAAFAVEDVKGYALLDTGTSRSVGGYAMVQYVIDCLSRNAAPPWLESADPAVSFTFAGGEKSHSETLIWLPLPGTRQELFAVHVVLSEVTPI